MLSYPGDLLEVHTYQIKLVDILYRESVTQNNIEDIWIKIKETVIEAAETYKS